MAALNVKILKFGDGKLDRVVIPIASGAAVNKGDLVSYESGTYAAVDAAGDDATFLGVSEDYKASTDTSLLSILVITQCVALAPVESASYTVGQGLKYNTNGTLEADGSANTIAWSVEDTGGVAVTSLRVLIDTVKLGKLFPVSA